MHHGNINKSTARGLKTLKERIERAKIPSSKLDENILIATWNIREFGKKKQRRKQSLHYIAEIIGRFNLVGIVELYDNLTHLHQVLKILGPYWKVIFSDYIADAKGNRERIAYVYDKRVVTFTGLAAELDSPRKKNQEGELVSEIEWWRSPFMASFRAGNFDFIVITAHIRWGSYEENQRVAPLKMLAEWIDKRRNEKYVVDKDIIVMGDFNITSRSGKLYRALTSKGLRVPKALSKKPGTNLAQVKHYDQILHYPCCDRSFTDKAGVLDFYMDNHRALYTGMSKSKFVNELSDHLPLWAEINTNLEEQRLDQILNS